MRREGLMFNGHKCSLYQLGSILNLDYVTMLAIKDDINPKLKRKELISNHMIEKYLCKTKISNFHFVFENSNINFLDRLINEQIYDLTKDSSDWLDPKTMKFLLDISPWEISKLRKLKKISFKQVQIPLRKSTSRNAKKYVYERDSVIEFISHTYGQEMLKKSYYELTFDKQFCSISKALTLLKNIGIIYSQATVYRKIDSLQFPVNQFNNAYRIPLLELNNFIASKRDGIY